MAVPLDAKRVISGNFGKVYDVDGMWLTNVTSIEANIEIGMEEVRRSGTRWLGNKTTTLKGSGSIGGYMVTSEWTERMNQVTDDVSSPFVTELIAELDDPESFGAYRVRLKNVTFDNIPVINFEVGSLVEQEYTFVFSGYEVIDAIRPN
ncbi:phage tail tube protein (plasmid) [Paenibacillus sp. JNUCC32]|uniref:phage tail tube protein n=1 Tax=Paenibacillus sp. JNUCC32 TaxID=2777984 RepID=UPI001787822F|nr:phage tail tube protein [Paenibacillus sp. JNUCC-32]QOT13735.1 phage tail tube protein [Paenibacillus sp. JNUCC-32]